jgi:hypothetical protein
MKKTSAILAIAAVLNLAILPHLPVHADILPSRTSQTGKADKTRVAAELATRGVDLRSAVAQVDTMSARDLDYFAADPRRIQLAAGLLLEEWLIAGGFGLFLLYLTAVAVVDVNYR